MAKSYGWNFVEIVRFCEVALQKSGDAKKKASYRGERRENAEHRRVGARRTGRMLAVP
jgi:hypothetical protein